MNIPALPLSPIVDMKTGYITDDWKQFFDQIVSEFNINASPEGLVLPTQAAANITLIQNNQLTNLSYTCQYGTGLYNSTANSIMFAVNNGSGAPLFKTVTLT